MRAVGKWLGVVGSEFGVGFLTLLIAFGFVILLFGGLVLLVLVGWLVLRFLGCCGIVLDVLGANLVGFWVGWVFWLL